ncbi:hypothetical protein KMD03_gp04 [Lactococcus phage CHPC1183]|uniref:Uncharacterized protein n=1 Tax=Lactococcus phage CHPC1183 TaxID=2675243 RepID=A0A650EUF1_9CAUD|nr:hypothetical protein KMD03_gp04 [Lactococcus phage CHPC1183]QGT52654.1 hypothetical protein CHPC1183_000308 [Lactococcus phage CHPC1183]
MINLQNKKLDIKEFLEDLGFTVSLDYEREPLSLWLFVPKKQKTAYTGLYNS